MTERIYTVFWVYVANYADQPVEVKAETPEEAITKAFPYYAESGDKVTFMVFEGRMVHQSKPFYNGSTGSIVRQ